MNSVNENFLMSGVDLKIDSLVDENRSMLRFFEKIIDEIEMMVSRATTSTPSATRYATLGLLEKEGYYISLSKNRFASIEKEFASCSIEIEGKRVYFEEFNVKKLTNSVKITSDFTDRFSDKIMQNRNKIVALVKERYVQLQETFERRYKLLFDRVIHYVADLDVAVSSSKVATLYNYSRAEIVDVKDDENFLQIEGLRHPLIEVQDSQGIYIPNSIIMGERKYLRDSETDSIMLDESVHNNQEINGVLLYGINSSGKSSLMKSVGVSVLLAQTGFFTPTSKMRFSIFESIFTRIVSKDNLSKGLSTFAVEMLELKNIFNRACTKSLILGDEISHGTETLSGVAIVASAIMKLSKIRSLFIFATHLHQLATMKEIQELKNVVNLHLSVEYDEEKDALIFNRTLQAGSGSSIYGLEFAKSLHMDREFLQNANTLRKRLADDFDGVEMLLKKKKSKYNQELYVTKCIICSDVAEDVHHISHQSQSDENGFVMTSRGLELDYE